MANTWGSLNAANSAPLFQVFAGQGANTAGTPFYANDTTMFISANSVVGGVGSVVPGLRLSEIGVNNKQVGVAAQATVAALPGLAADNTVANNSTKETASHAVHVGWQNRTEFTGPLTGISLLTAGAGVNSAGFVILGGTGTGYNISYTIANTQNLQQASSTLPMWNGVATVTLVSGGANFNGSLNATQTLNYQGSSVANTPQTQPTFAFTFGGRAGRVQYETMIAMANIA